MSKSLFGSAPLSTAYGAVTGGKIDEESAQKLANIGEPLASTGLKACRSSSSRDIYDYRYH